MGSAGDVNGDGLSDVVVGALGYDVASSNDNRGRAYLYLGNALGLSAAPSLIIQGDQNFANFGSAVSRAGDANGDGYGDVIVGAQSHDNGSTNEGRAFLYYGNENGSPTLRPRQKRATGRPLAVLDRTGPSTFQLSVEFDRDLTGVAWSRPGGSTARLQWELAPLGGTFDGIPDGESAPQTITGTTLSFDELIGGLLPDTLYHWRARIATTNPLYPNTPWFTIQGRPVTEAKFRTQKAKAQATSGTPGNGGTRTIP